MANQNTLDKQTLITLATQPGYDAPVIKAIQGLKTLTYITLTTVQYDYLRRAEHAGAYLQFHSTQNKKAVLDLALWEVAKRGAAMVGTAEIGPNQLTEIRISYSLMGKILQTLGFYNKQHLQVQAQAITIVTTAQPQTQPVEKETPDLDAVQLRWPQPPPLINGLGSQFRQPAWYNTMEYMVAHGRHIALAGPPGVGKDTAVQEMAAKQGKILVTVGGDAGFRRRDLVGSAQVSHGTSFLEVAEYAAAVVNGWWALVTEVNAADADALMFMNAQLAAPYMINIAGKAYPVHPDFRLFITYNPGLTGTKPLPQSFKDRFFSIQVPFFTLTQLKSLLTAHGMPDAAWGNDIVNFGIALWDTFTRGTIRYQITTRRLQDAVELMKGGVVSSSKEALKLAVISAIDSPIEAKAAEQVLNNVLM